MTIIEALERLQVDTMEFWLGITIAAAGGAWGLLYLLDQRTKIEDDKDRF